MPKNKKTNKYNINDIVYYYDGQGPVETVIIKIRLWPEFIEYSIQRIFDGIVLEKPESELKRNPRLLKQIQINDDVYWFNSETLTIQKTKVVEINEESLKVYGGFTVSIEEAYRKERDLIDSLKGY